jgi:hypothetical protein
LAEAEAGEVEITRQAIVGSPSHKIVQFAVVEKVHLILIATLGRIGLKPIFM